MTFELIDPAISCSGVAGHFSTSGRFDRLKDTAREFAFLLKTTGMLLQEAMSE